MSVALQRSISVECKAHKRASGDALLSALAVLCQTTVVFPVC